jgi:hypothetical protein
LADAVAKVAVALELDYTSLMRRLTLQVNAGPGKSRHGLLMASTWVDG